MSKIKEMRLLVVLLLRSTHQSELVVGHETKIFALHVFFFCREPMATMGVCIFLTEKRIKDIKTNHNRMILI